MKQWCIKLFRALGLYILDMLKKAWEDCLKEYLAEQLHNVAGDCIGYLKEYHNSEAYESKKKEIIEKVMDTIKLPLPLRPFKWLIKKILYDTIEKKVQAALDKLDTLV